MLTVTAMTTFWNLREAVALYVAVLPATEGWILTTTTSVWSSVVCFVTAATDSFRRGSQATGS